MKKGVLCYEYIVVDMLSKIHAFTSNRKLNLGEVSKIIGVGSELIFSINCYEIPKHKGVQHGN